MTPFFDPLRCPICSATLPSRPLGCPVCEVDLTGPIVVELVTTLRRADTLADQMRAQMLATPMFQTSPMSPMSPMSQMSQTHPAPPVSGPGRTAPTPTAAPRSWFAGTSVGVILLVLGALCVLAAGVVFVAVAWTLLPLAIRTVILVLVTAGFGLFADLALRRGLQATAEAMAVTAFGMFILDLAAARSAGLLGLADLAPEAFTILVGVLLVAVALAAVLVVRSRRRALWTLDAVVAGGVATAVTGLLVMGEGRSAELSVALTAILSLLYLGWRRLRLPIAMWGAAVLGAMSWLLAVAIGSERLAQHSVGSVGSGFGGDVGHLAAAWPALVVALIAALWSIRLTQPGARRVAAGLSLLPVVLVVEIIGWSHGWVVGTMVLLVGYVIAAMVSAHVSAVWSPAVGGVGWVWGLSAALGVIPTLVMLATRLGLWLAPSTTDVAPWLLPLTTLALLAVLPQLTTGSHRLTIEPRYTAAAFVASLALMPVLYGASFWLTFTVLVVVALALMYGARLWRDDVLLLLGLFLLAVMRIFANHDSLADPLAWTIIAVAAAAWALTESRLLGWAAFLAAAGLVALLAVVQWLAFAQVPHAIQGLVVVVVGSLGLVASQRLSRTSQTSQTSRTSARALPSGALTTRVLAEGLSTLWVVAGLAMADASPSHRALELTVAGVAAGITAYLSQDRRPAGWVSGTLLTAASWIRLLDTGAQAVEWYSLPAATALLVYGVRRRRADPGESTWRCLGPGLTLALTPSLLLALGQPVSWRGLLVGLCSVALVAVGVRGRLAAPFVLGVVATGLLALRNIWPVAAFVPRWTLLFLIGGVLLATGMTWEARVRDVRTARWYVRGLR